MNKLDKIAIASDHAGFPLKELIKEHLILMNYEFYDFGTKSAEPVDYPDYAKLVIEAIENGKCSRGILICGSGVGMCIVANRSKKIRAALSETPMVAELARKHNDVNVLALGAKIISVELALECVRKFLTSEFEAERHEIRLSKFS
jgi:ribose 5-phosphate isomerase B